MENNNFFVEMKEMLEAYVADRLLLIKLQATEKAAKASSALFIGLIIGAIGLVVVLIVSFIAGYLLSQAVQSYVGGFGILAGIYVLLIFLLLFIHRRYTSKAIANRVIQFSLHSTDTEDHAA